MKKAYLIAAVAVLAAAAAVAVAEQTAEQLAKEAFDRGNRYSSSDSDRILAEYNEAIRLDSGKAEYYYRRGYLYQYMKDNYDMAVADYTSAIQLDSNNADYYGKRAFAYAYAKLKRDLNRAIADYGNAIRLDSGNAEHYRWRARTHTRAGNCDQAIKDYTEAIRLRPNDASYYTGRGEVYSGHSCKCKGPDFLKLAVIDLTEAIRLEPENKAQVYADRGYMYYTVLKDYDKAIADYSEASRFDPDAYYIGMRGQSYHAKGDYVNAIADFERSLRIDPKGIGHETVREELAAARSALSAAYAKAEAAAERGHNAYFNENNNAKAIKAYTDAIRFQPDPEKRASHYCARALAYVGVSKPDSALGDLSEAINIDPTAAHYSRRGNLHGAMGNYASAVEDFTMSVGLDPSGNGYAERAYLYFAKLGDFDRAAADYSEAMKLNPENSYYIRMRGRSHHAKGDYAAAIADFQYSLCADKSGIWHEAVKRERAEAAEKLGSRYRFWHGMAIPCAGERTR